MEFTLIILTLLSRLAPVQAASWLAAFCIDWAVRVLEDDDYRAWLDEDQMNAQWFGAWLGFIEGWLDVLISIEAGRLMKRRWRVDPPGRQPIRSIRSAGDAFNRVVLICERFADFERLARLRAVKLKRLFDALDPLGPSGPHRLLTAFADTSPSLRLREENRASFAALFLPRVADRGRWFAALPQTGGGSIRAPP